MRGSTKLLAALLVVLILVGTYKATKKDPSVITHDIGISSPANGKLVTVTLIGTPGINTIVLKMTHTPTKEKTTRTYTRAAGDKTESIVLGANVPQATTVSINIRWS